MTTVIQKYSSTDSMRMTLHIQKSSSVSPSISFCSILACTSKSDSCQIQFKILWKNYILLLLSSSLSNANRYICILTWKVGDENKDMLELEIREPQCFNKFQIQKRILVQTNFKTTLTLPFNLWNALQEERNLFLHSRRKVL